MSLLDQINNYEYEQILKRKMVLVYFLSMVKMQNNERMTQYQEKLKANFKKP